MMIRSLRSRVSMTLADAVVGQRSVEGLDEFGGGEVADLVAGVDGGDAERDQDVGSCRCRRARSGRRSPRRRIHSSEAR